MLDERLEYEQITDANFKYNRLKYGSLKDGLSGIERPMTIVARKFIWDFAKNLTVTDRIFIAKTALRAWCGHKYKDAYYKLKKGQTDEWVYCSKEDFKAAKICKENQIQITTPLNEKYYIEFDPKSKYTTSEAILAKCPELFSDKISDFDFSKKIKNEIKRLDNWLNNYIKIVTTGKEYEQYRLLTNMLASKKYGRKLFNDKFEDFGIDGIKTITYEKIIANALNEGELKTYNLQCFSKMISSESKDDVKKRIDTEINTLKDKAIPSKMPKTLIQLAFVKIEDETKKYFESFPNYQESLSDIFSILNELPIENQKTYHKFLQTRIKQVEKIEKCRMCIPAIFDNVEIIIAQEDGTTKNNPLTDTTIQRHLLMLVAYFLIEAAKYKKNGKSHKIWFNKTDFKNWSGWNVSVKNIEDSFVYNSKDFDGNPIKMPLFLAEGFDNTIKLGVNSKWLEDYNIEVVEQTEKYENPKFENTKDKERIISISEENLISFGKKGKQKDDKNDK